MSSGPAVDFKIGADTKQFRSAIGNIDHSLKKLSGGFGALGGLIGATFAVNAIQEFAAESLDLAAKMQGVETAFNRLNDPNLLDNLRRATGGTVNDLKLMQTAVKAKNFRIPMDALAKGLEFAQRRAQATGESVDYMVDSFVTGMGRESVKILDNLGISALELTAKTKELGSMSLAVTEIMQKEFDEAGDRIVTTSMKIDQQKTALTNLKTELGEKLMPVYEAFLSQTIAGLSTINILASKETSGKVKAGQALKQYLTLAGKQNSAMGKLAIMAVDLLTTEETLAKNREKNAPTEESKLAAEEALAQAKIDNAALTIKLLKEYQEKVDELTPSIEQATRKVQELFSPQGDGKNLAHTLGFKDASMELEEIGEDVEEFEENFDASFIKLIESVRMFSTEIMMVARALETAFMAAFAPLEEGETRLGNFVDVFAQELKRMALSLLATAAAAAILAAVLSVAMGGSNLAGSALFGKSGMKFGDLFGSVFGQMGGGFGINSGGTLGGDTGGGMNIIGILRGSDILLSTERAGRNRNRLSGIGG